jgi:NADH:ubiquinone oxidoreductase subunit K
MQFCAKRKLSGKQLSATDANGRGSQQLAANYRPVACAPRKNPPMTPTLTLFLIISAALFSIGLLAALSRRHAIFILIGIEMMLAAANLNFIAFWRFGPQPQSPTGVMVAIFSIAIAAAEAAVGLALVIAVYRHYRTTNVDKLDQLKG